MSRDRLRPQVVALKGSPELVARVTPAVGANLVSFEVDGTELIHWDEAAFLAGESFTGAFNMFPTPCRLDGSTYEFEGRRILQTKRGEKVFIHGLVRDEAMDYRNEGSRLTSWIDITPSHPVYEGFPFSCRFSVTHALEESALIVGFSVENRDTRNIPFGYGVHPFWRLHGRRRDVRVRVPCDYVLDLENLVPTGGYTAVEGTDLDLRGGRSLEGFYIDNAFWKRRSGETAELSLRSIGRRIVFSASDSFAHMIVYAPEGRPFVCVENLTTCPNAPNLVSTGRGEVAGMLLAAPGQTVDGWVRYTIASAV